ncbi:MAG: hypothetical protein J6Y19_10810 [Kiritimatiellae bacterium]|nr:hypothetical protein [Kiritimatiellia bacterium]
MKLRPANRLLSALAFALLAASASPALAQFAGQTVRGFRLPEYNDDGTLRQLLSSESATILEGGLLQLGNPQIELYNHGLVSVRIQAPECAFDQARKRAASREHIRIVTDKAVLTGDGFAWNGENEQFQIFSNVRVSIAADSGLDDYLAASAAAPSAQEPQPSQASPSEPAAPATPAGEPSP